MNKNHVLNDNKDIRVTIRLNFKEHEFLKQLAHDSHATISDYIRYRVFEELDINTKNLEQEEITNNKSKFACDHDREVMRHLLRVFLYTRFMADKILDEPTLKKCSDMAWGQLKQWGYDE